MGDESATNPTLNGGQRKGDMLACGCDPSNAELDDQGQKKVLATRINSAAFESLGLDIKLAWTYCCQCKEVFKIEAISTTPAGPLIELPS